MLYTISHVKASFLSRQVQLTSAYQPVLTCNYFKGKERELKNHRQKSGDSREEKNLNF